MTRGSGGTQPSVTQGPLVTQAQLTKKAPQERPPGGIGGDRWGHGGANFALIALFRIRLALFPLTFLLARSLS